MSENRKPILDQEYIKARWEKTVQSTRQVMAAPNGTINWKPILDQNHIEALWEQYTKKLDELNDENQTQQEHDRKALALFNWHQGVLDGTGQFLNGDFHYLELMEAGEIPERPMCNGQFLDWKSKK